jgi:ADP-dependent NAD(P)H-hydrate dehydratase / NAD(P)H-hydrate epimerase
MKILLAEQIRNADRYTIENEPIPSIRLMERAARAFVQWFTGYFNPGRRVLVCCGTGNNGGDGLAIARMLHQNQWEVEVWIAGEEKGGSPDFAVNRAALEGMVPVFHRGGGSPAGREIDPGCIVVDALFGTGLSRPVAGAAADLIRDINRSGATVVSVDVPSGLPCDGQKPSGEVVRAEHVVTFQLPKLAFLLPGNAEWVRHWHVADIGLSPAFIEGAPAGYELIGLEELRPLYRERNRFAHKAQMGRALLLTGSRGKMGAAVLCARACLRGGAGLLTMAIPACGYTVLQAAVPEAMVLCDEHPDLLSRLPDLSTFDTLGIGPGIGQAPATRDVLYQLLSSWTSPAVFDADALNLLAAEPGLLDLLPPGSILTPHPGEFRRLAGGWDDELQRLGLQRALSERLGIFIVVKGAYTAVSCPDGMIYFNGSGNPGMATGGSGDVLTGLLTALLGQGYPPKDAALLGVYLHGLAGDLARADLGEEALVASDIIDYLPDAWQHIRGDGYQ